MSLEGLPRGRADRPALPRPASCRREAGKGGDGRVRRSGFCLDRVSFGGCVQLVAGFDDAACVARRLGVDGDRVLCLEVEVALDAEAEAAAVGGDLVQAAVAQLRETETQVGESERVSPFSSSSVKSQVEAPVGSNSLTTGFGFSGRFRPLSSSLLRCSLVNSFMGSPEGMRS